MKDQVEAEQLKQKAEARSHANQALQEYNKLQAMKKIRDEQAASGNDNTEAYAAILD